MKYFRAALLAHPFFRKAPLNEASDAVESHSNAPVIHFKDSVGGASTSVITGRCSLPRSELWFCSHGGPVTLRIPDSNYIRIQFGVSGVGATRTGRHNVAVTENNACVSAGAADIDFGIGFQQVAWRIGISELTNAMSALTDSPITTPLRFEPQLDLSRTPSRAMLGILHLMLQNLEIGSSAACPLLLAELEQALIVSFLCGSSHNYRNLLDRRSADPASWQVRRAEAYIESHWNQPISIQAITEATGASARSIFRTFKKFRGCSPLEFVKQVRLRNAREMLRGNEPATSVTKVALDCGYSDLAHFSRDFHAAYGERPSDLLSRHKMPRDRRPLVQSAAA